MNYYDTHDLKIELEICDISLYHMKMNSVENS